MFFKFQPKNTQIRHFPSKNQVFLFFRETLQIDTFQGADFKYDYSFLKNLEQKHLKKAFLVKNTLIRHFLSQIQAFLFLHKMLQLDKFEGIDFKYHNSFLKFQRKNTQVRYFWCQNQAFLFPKILQLHKLEDADFKYGNIVFKLQPKDSQSGIFCTKFRHFCFFVKFCKQANLRVLTSNITTVF